jgi:hypothetical protein
MDCQHVFLNKTNCFILYMSQHISTGFKLTTKILLGYAVAQLVEALRYKPEGRGFNSRWSHWNFSVT